MTQKKRYLLKEIAEFLALELRGDSECEIHGLGTLTGAGPTHLSFLSNKSYIDQLGTTRAGAVLVTEDFLDKCPGNALISRNPYVSFAQATSLFLPEPANAAGVHPTAVIADDVEVPASVSIAPHVVIESGVRLGEGVRIGAGCFIGAGSRLGANCRLYNGVTLYHGVSLGENVIIHSGTVIGADGFGFAFDGEKSIKIHQLGGVDIGDNVEIGAGSTIDRGAIENTVIGQGVKIDNQVQIGHNTQIGDHTVICGCTAIAGSATIGKYCVLGGASGMVGHLTIADGVQVSAMSLVSRSITEAGTYSSGTGQMKTSDWKRAIVRFQQLDSIARRVKELELLTDKNS
ncbi:MAG: UDP-3-O-(3-hydroxymyristoyl)glucosamine N-acyltransferase [Proteobacteria bacterium]|nr:UDP-3-O-(3-hydroxymyristoyl)glucosamine N-acyltransferase [Pseudomonadota bacterium]MDA0928994.1 UDP-3-O-(3-hydroxymyristoyl)glucosamine N-acyltransferase [Pseudomonadota bacterium]